MITTSEAYVSIGRLADRHDCDKRTIEAAAVAAGVSAKSWDGVVYFNTTDAERIGERLDKREANEP